MTTPNEPATAPTPTPEPPNPDPDAAAKAMYAAFRWSTFSEQSSYNQQTAREAASAAVAVALPQLLAENEKLKAAAVPLCIGEPIITLLATDGQYETADGRGLVAASDLFHNNPYERLRAVEKERDELRDSMVCESDRKWQARNQLVKMEQRAYDAETECDTLRSRHVADQTTIEELRAQVAKFSPPTPETPAMVPFSIERWNAGERKVFYRDGTKPVEVTVLPESFASPVRSRTENCIEHKHAANGTSVGEGCVMDLLMPAPVPPEPKRRWFVMDVNSSYSTKEEAIRVRNKYPHWLIASAIMPPNTTKDAK